MTCEIRVYERLFSTPFPGRETGKLLDDLNPNSKFVFKNSKIPKGLVEQLEKHPRWQFERKGYYFVDKDSDLSNGKVVLNQIIDLK